MPQVDQATFFPITFWVFVLFLVGFLLINYTTLFTFLRDIKVDVKVFLRHAQKAVRVKKIVLNNTLLFPWLNI